MESRPLGTTGLSVSLLGLGTGGANVFGQRRGAGPTEARAMVRTALDRGVTFFDTAAGYQQSEELLGFALDGVPRSAFVVAS
jgi:pyridoxine 4-dehydrogenase